MKRLQRLILIASLFLSISANSQPLDSSTADEERTARELLNISGGGKLGVKVFQQLIGSFKQSMPNVPDSFWVAVSKEVDPNELVNLAVPIYVKHFTVEEMNGIMEFYKTPAGAKLVQDMPDITQEMMLAGQQWGKDIAQKVLKKLKDGGYQK